MDPTIARKTWRTLEPIHGMIYFTPHGASAYEAAGIVGPGANRMGYFGSRAAPMGAASAELVISTFYNFNPELVRRCVPRVWELASPAAVLAARFHAVDVSLRAAFDDELLASPDLVEAATLARSAAEAACDHLEGRPLFAAHASLPWPDEPHLALWHAQTLLREYRGDGHIAALVIEGLSGIEALVTHAASGDVPAAVLKATRAWNDAAWNTAVEGLRVKGIIEAADDSYTEKGRKLRQRIEERTDALSVAPYAALGDDACERLRTLGRPLSQAVLAAGLLTIDPARFADETDETAEGPNT
jgi:hypothetical protein